MIDYAKAEEENLKQNTEKMASISEENNYLKMRLNNIIKENENLLTEKGQLQFLVEENNTMVSEKHITFQRINSQNNPNLTEFEDLNSSVENSPIFRGPETGESSEKPVPLDSSSTAGKRAIESPGDSPSKKIGNFPETGTKIWIQNNKDGCRTEYFVLSKRNKSTFNLINNDKLKVSKNFRDLTWGYVDHDSGNKLPT